MRSDLEIKALQAFHNLAVETPNEVQAVGGMGVTSETFTDRECGALWAYLKQVTDAKRRPDAASAARALVGVVKTELISEVFISNEPPLSASERLALLRDFEVRRVAVNGMRSVATLFKGKGTSIEEAVLELRKLADSIHAPSGGTKNLTYDTMALLDRMEEIDQGARVPIIPTGISVLDGVIGGFQNTLMILGAYPGVGKSALVAAMVRNLALAGVKVGVLSLEDEATWLPARIISEAAKVPLFSLQFRKLLRGQKEDIQEQVGRVFDSFKNVLRDDRSGLSVAEVVESCRSMVREGAKVLIVDHLGEIHLERSDRHDLDVADALRSLRALAKNYGVSVLVVAHMKRGSSEVIYEEPKLTDFAFSAALERMARVALGLWKEKGNDEVINCTVLKQTNGVANTMVRLPFNKLSAIVSREP